MSKKLKVEDKDYNLDPSLWRLVEVDGYPVAALYFNGREFSLGVEAMEDLTKIISEYIQAEQDVYAHPARTSKSWASRSQYIDRLPENVFARGDSEDDNDSGCGHNHT